MKIIRLNEVNSTQSYLKEYIQKNGYNNPLCVTSKIQTAGFGSRGNSWIGKEGNLFFSFVVSKDNLPKDLPEGEGIDWNVVIVDATEIPIQRPKKTEEKL